MNSPYLQHIQSQKVFEKFLSLFCCHSFSSTGYILNTWVTNSCNFLFFLLLFSISSYFTFEKDAGWLAKNFPKLLRNCAVIPSGHFYSGKHFLKIEEKKQVRLCWFCLGRIANSQIFHTNHIFRPKSARKLPCSDDYNLSSILNNLAYRAFKP